ncbi:superfamily II DNA/RNA helicase [Chitinophaga niastensis]|uniref:Superfamily II DNA/RNA helicase n=1 Tax=Chitinophaga niastensis TaxID=536980 RepID=A0A2P8HJ71_CHINA|nr:DEAD/DEAH box helicase [Chitinophaga niastensis]PSL46262.1 superfamily II DNA/RNA helicase [Chitinophaga niastensis]
MQKEKYSLGNILTNLKIDSLNEMQQASVDANKQHADVILLSATGSGKTLAFLLPILELLDPANKNTQALIVVPSRELALQIEKVFKLMGTGYKITACYGGHLRETEENNLVQPPAVIVGTPGRLGDHIRRENITVDSIETLILDEFDKTLELGFQEEVSFIIDSLPNIKKRILTSATETVDIPEFLALNNPEKLDFLPEEGSPAARLAIWKVMAPESDKVETLFRLICYLGNRSTIVFCNHREAVERTSKMLSDKSITNTFYHGAMEQQERDAALCKFRNGSVNVLVTTDLAARGLDIPNIRYIVHFHLPHTEDSWTHRNGRTARMEASGTAIVILAPDEKLMSYIDEEVVTIELPETSTLPEKPKWTTIFIAAGKKNKVNKIDIVGFLGNRAHLKKEDIGLIEVKDFFSFVAIVKSKVGHALELIKNEKIKNKKVKIDIAR